VQFQRVPTFYANLFAKVFCYLEENDPTQEWVAVAIFASRAEESVQLGPYEDLLQSQRVKRIYLDEHTAVEAPPVGLGVLRLLFAPENEAQTLAPRLVQQIRIDFAGSDLAMKVVELLERALMRRFPGLDQEEIRMKFELHDIRESNVWKEAVEEGKTILTKKLIKKLLAIGLTHKQLAEAFEIPVAEVRRIAKSDVD
jgi:predicted transposase YdaD